MMYSKLDGIQMRALKYFCMFNLKESKKKITLSTHACENSFYRKFKSYDMQTTKKKNNLLTIHNSLIT